MTEPDEDEFAEETRVTKSLAALAFVLFLVVTSLYLTEVLRQASNIEDCVLSGRRDCPIFSP